jgi:hypothetical protein
MVPELMSQKKNVSQVKKSRICLWCIFMQVTNPGQSHRSWNR